MDNEIELPDPTKIVDEEVLKLERLYLGLGMSVTREWHALVARKSILENPARWVVIVGHLQNWEFKHTDLADEGWVASTKDVIAGKAMCQPLVDIGDFGRMNLYCEDDQDPEVLDLPFCGLEIMNEAGLRRFVEIIKSNNNQPH